MNDKKDGEKTKKIKSFNTNGQIAENVAPEYGDKVTKGDAKVLGYVPSGVVPKTYKQSQFGDREIL